MQVMDPRKAAEPKQRNEGNMKGGCYLPFGREREKETSVGDQQENKCSGQGRWGEEPWWLQLLLKDYLQ